MTIGKLAVPQATKRWAKSTQAMMRSDRRTAAQRFRVFWVTLIRAATPIVDAAMRSCRKPPPCSNADDSRFGAALARINGKILALQSRIAKFAVAFVAIR